MRQKQPEDNCAIDGTQGCKPCVLSQVMLFALGAYGLYQLAVHYGWFGLA